MEKKLFANKLIAWYEQNKRDLPWRNTKDPYKIWLSEIILQQTRVVQGMPYYLKFVEQYPTVKDLAAAEEKEVLRLWQGLGYYSRARSLHTTARIIAEEYDGVFPDNYQDLLKLKGIGPYTAAAIASFAFGEKVAVVDGNVYRVLARVFGVETDIASHEAKKVFGELANELISAENPSTYNQAIMEFGATYCTPQSPECMFCIFHLDCEANATGRQSVLPIKSKKVKVRKRYFDYFVIEKEGKVLMKQRGKNDIWAGLFDYYLLENDEKLKDLDEIKDVFIDSIKNNATIESVSEVFTHILTHQRIEARFWKLSLKSEIEISDGYMFYEMNEIDDLPKPILIEKYFKKTLENV